MLANLGSALAEQRSAVLLLVTRAGGAPRDVAATNTMLRSVFAHLGVIEDIVLPFVPENSSSATVAAAAKVVAGDVTKFARTPASAESLGNLNRTLAFLFLAEGELLRGMHGDKTVVDQTFLTRVDDAFHGGLGRERANPMADDALSDSRRRFQAMFDQTARTLLSSIVLVDRQRATVEWLEIRGYPTLQARELHATMIRVVNTLRWQKAWLGLDLRRSTHLMLHTQPYPWDTPPPELLSPVCDELERIVAEDVIANDVEATNRAIDAAILLAVGRHLDAG